MCKLNHLPQISNVFKKQVSRSLIILEAELSYVFDETHGWWIDRAHLRLTYCLLLNVVSLCPSPGLPLLTDQLSTGLLFEKEPRGVNLDCGPLAISSSLQWFLFSPSSLPGGS